MTANYVIYRSEGYLSLANVPDGVRIKTAETDYNGIEVAIIHRADWISKYNEDVFVDQGCRLVFIQDVKDVVEHLNRCDCDVFVDSDLAKRMNSI